jgi:hypothetical protein
MKPEPVWRWPIGLAVLTLFGLIAALLGEGGLWWILSWLALAAPLVVMAICVAKAHFSGGRPKG